MAKSDRSPFRVSVAQGRVIVRVTFDKEWQEYRCRITVDGQTNAAADYFTDDAEDAQDTAHAMAAAAAAKLQPIDLVLF